jgi:hypothetical protein
LEADCHATAITTVGSDRGFVEMEQLDIRTFESRLALSHNTLFKTSSGYETVVAKDANNTYNMEQTASEVVFPVPAVYSVDYAWLIIYFIAMGVMLSAAIVSLLVRWQCRAPTILGNVSSLTRDSRYFAEAGGSAHSIDDGSERGKRLRNLKVMVGDVRADAEGVGRVAFVPAEMGTRIEKGKWYM